MEPRIQPNLTITDESLGDDGHVISVTGEIDLAGAPRLSERINEALQIGKQRILVDLTETSFIDSTGLSVLLNALRRIIRVNGRLVLACDNPTVLRLFEITKTDSTFEIHDSLRAAEAALRR